MRGPNSEIDDAGRDYQRAIRHLPHSEVDEKVFGVAMPWYQDMINNASPSAEFWLQENQTLVRAVPESLQVPILMIGGWYDVFFGPQLEDWQRLRTRSESRFVIGPWTHIGRGGEALETPDAEGGLFQWHEMLPWLDHHLKGAPLSQAKGVMTYVLRENRWKEYADWPPAGEKMRFYLDNAERANNCSGGELNLAVPEAETSITYRYDPADPTPSRGGAGMLAFILPGFGGAPPANVLQNGLCEREDVITFITGALKTPIRIAGDISVSLQVSSSATDTAFTAKLIEVLPDGREINIRDSITSLAYRNGAQTPLTYEPESKISITIEFWPIEWTLGENSKLRLDISSSDFPKYHAHRNQFGNWPDLSDMVIATQSIYSGENSWVEFNVIP